MNFMNIRDSINKYNLHHRLLLSPRRTLLRVFTVLLAFTLSFNIGFLSISVDKVHAESGSTYNGSGTTIYVPLIVTIPTVAALPAHVLLGIYPPNFIGSQAIINNDLKTIDTWSGKQLSLVGIFEGVEDPNPAYNMPTQMGLLWNAGYTPFINLETSGTLANINSGSLDSKFQAMALAFKAWHDTGVSSGQNRIAFVAPLPEMNGQWVSYYGSPANFKTAWARIRGIFASNGASSAVRWVFAPNGWSDTANGVPGFESFYPGDSSVDVIAFSSYNFGDCTNSSWKTWDEPSVVFAPYITRMETMAPTKPIIIAQTGTVSIRNGVDDTAAKNQWLIDSYNYLSSEPNVLGVIYFNLWFSNATSGVGAGLVCQWYIYKGTSIAYAGYPDVVGTDQFIYKSPSTLAAESLDLQ
jgi:hypothetical protein